MLNVVSKKCGFENWMINLREEIETQTYANSFEVKTTVSTTESIANIEVLEANIEIFQKAIAEETKKITKLVAKLKAELAIAEASKSEANEQFEIKLRENADLRAELQMETAKIANQTRLDICHGNSWDNLFT